jgi:hypothetical protein
VSASTFTAGAHEREGEDSGVSCGSQPLALSQEGNLPAPEPASALSIAKSFVGTAAPTMLDCAPSPDRGTGTVRKFA